MSATIRGGRTVKIRGALRLQAGRLITNATAITEGVDLSRITFTPAVGSDWDGPPTTVAEALDELAARLRVLEPP